MKKMILFILSLILILNASAAFCDGDQWYCPNCGRSNTENYCPNCGEERPSGGEWTCASCGQAGNTGNYCPNCSAARNSGSAAINYSVNSVVKFGSYPQKGSSKESIQWKILDIQGNEALLMSVYALDCVPYNLSATAVTWETSYVRQWLNDSFYNTAFSSTEKNVIVKKTIRNTANPYYPNTNPGPDTQDNVFLLSVDEALRYLPRDTDRLIVTTEYAFSRGGYRNNNGNDYAWWWMRSPGKDAKQAVRVRADATYDGKPAGYIGTNDVTDTEDVVIPCIWVRLSGLNGTAASPSAGQWVPSGSSQGQPASYPGSAQLKSAVATRSGPGTNYDEPGTFFYKNDVWKTTRVKVLGKKYNGVWWVLVDFDYGSLGWIRAWTGLKRVDVDLNSLPEINPTGYGTVSATQETRYGPGAKYAKAPGIYESKSVTIYGRENGYVEVEYYSAYDDMNYRCWVPEGCVY